MGRIHAHRAIPNPAWANAVAMLATVLSLVGCEITKESGPAPIILHLSLADSLRNYDKVVVDVSPANDTSIVTENLHNNVLDTNVIAAKTLIATDPFVVKVRGYRGNNQLAVQTLIYFEGGKKRVVHTTLPPLIPYNILSRLSATPGVLDPTFSPDISRYTLTMPSGATTVSFNLKSAYDKASITLNGQEVKNTDPDKVLPLANFTYTLPIMVTDLGIGRDYFVTIKPPKDIRVELDSMVWSSGVMVPPFSGSSFEYDLTLPSTSAFVDLQFWPTDPANMIMLVLAKNTIPGAKVRIELPAPGASTVVTVHVSKANESKDYTFFIKRAQ